MHYKAYLACGLGLSLLFHLAFFFVLIADLSKRKSETGGFEAKFGDRFESIMIVSTLPLGELKEQSIASQKSKINPNQTRKTQEKQKESKKDNAFNLKEEINPAFTSLKNRDFTPQELSEQSQEQSLNSQSSAVNSDRNQLQKDDFTSSPMQGKSATTQTMVSGASHKEIKSYQGLVMAHLTKHKKYPNSALTQGKEGTAVLRISIDDNGNVLSSELRKTSGETLLDEESLNLITRANPLPKPPQNMLGNTNKLTFSIPIDYNIKEFLHSQH